jgi:hypothetical protein
VLVNASPQWLTDLTTRFYAKRRHARSMNNVILNSVMTAVVGRSAKSSSRIAARTAGAHCREQ